MTDEPGLLAHLCANDHLSYPGHQVCRECGVPTNEIIDLSKETGEVLTWTTSMATPPGVREPNTLAIVEVERDGKSVRVIGQVTTEDIEIGDTVEPVYVAELREPKSGIRASASQEWDGYRFRPVE